MSACTRKEVRISFDFILFSQEFHLTLRHEIFDDNHIGTYSEW